MMLNLNEDMDSPEWCTHLSPTLLKMGSLSNPFVGVLSTITISREFKFFSKGIPLLPYLL